METEFTPRLSLASTTINGASAVLLMATNGRITGIGAIASLTFLIGIWNARHTPELT